MTEQEMKGGMKNLDLLYRKSLLQVHFAFLFSTLNTPLTNLKEDTFFVRDEVKKGFVVFEEPGIVEKFSPMMVAVPEPR